MSTGKSSRRWSFRPASRRSKSKSSLGVDAAEISDHTQSTSRTADSVVISPASRLRNNLSWSSREKLVASSLKMSQNGNLLGKGSSNRSSLESSGSSAGNSTPLRRRQSSAVYWQSVSSHHSERSDVSVRSSSQSPPSSFSTTCLLPTVEEPTTSRKRGLLVGRSVREVLEYDVMMPLAHQAEKDREERCLSKQWKAGCNYSALVCFVSAQLALFLRSATPLYGVLAVLFLEVSWIIFKWSMYAFDDDDLRTNAKVLRAWTTFAINEGTDLVTHGKMRMIAPAIIASQKAAVIGTKVLRQKTHEMNLHMTMRQE